MACAAGSDGWSMGILYEELGALYSAALAGRACELPRLPIQYADFAAWQAARLEGELLQAQLGYWTRQLAGAPPLLELPTDLPRPAVRGGASGYAALRVPADVSQRLRDLASTAGVTMFMLVLAAWQVGIPSLGWFGLWALSLGSILREYERKYDVATV